MSGNSVLITGGSSGIGRALAEGFLSAGNIVAVCGRREDRLRALKEKHPEIHTRACDIGEMYDRRALVDWAQTAMPKMNILINNASVQREIDFTGGIVNYLSGANEIRINLEAPILLSGLFIPFLKKNPEAAIINVSSELGFVASGKMPVYSATKAAMHAFSMALRVQLKDIAVKVYEIITPADRDSLSAEEFAAAVIRRLEADQHEIGFGEIKN